LTRRSLGQRGEEIAVGHLASLGYEILERNVRTAAGEIDAVAREDGVIVFVEVKTRSGSGFGEPQEAVNRAKQRRLTRLAQNWLQVKGLTDRPARFDVVSVRLASGREARVELFRNAFEARE
jgi:putative endonuclease